MEDDNANFSHRRHLSSQLRNYLTAGMILAYLRRLRLITDLRKNYHQREVFKHALVRNRRI